MKAKHKFPTYFFGLFLLLTFSIPSSVKAQYDDVSLETFYDELSPYGVWIDDPQYGQVWRPDVDQDEFRPYYTNGHWEMTQYGNTWVSNYDWGWAPFHYGRWHHASRGGWVWVPGTDWGPAWVNWRSGGGYYGWAPMGPGININISVGSRIPDFFWVFVPQRSIYYSSYPRYDRQRNIGRIHNTIFINNTYAHNRTRYYSGPRAEDIRRVTHQNVTIHNVRNQRPGRTATNQGNRPQINRNSDQQSRTSPAYSSKSNSGNSTVNRQSPRPQRAGENSGVTNNGRSGNSVVKTPASQNASRQVNQGTSTSRSIQTNQGQRSGSNVRSSSGTATSRQTPAQIRQQSPQRQTNTSSRQVPAQTRQQSPQRQTNTSSRQAPAQTRQQSPQQQSNNSGRQVTSQGSRQQSSGQNRGSSANSSSQSSGKDQGRPSRSHK